MDSSVNNAERRLHLKRLAALGALVPAGLAGLIQDALAAEDAVVRQGFHKIEGAVNVNGKPATMSTIVKAGDEVSTAEGSTAMVVIGKDAYLLRGGTGVTFESNRRTPTIVTQVLVATGKLLAVFGKRLNNGVTIQGRNATIGIRGTGCYLEVGDTRSYFCLCYGEATIDCPGMAQPTRLKTSHHDNPVWLDSRGGVTAVETANYAYHTDAELIMLEALQGREPPFVALGLYK